MSLRKRPVSSDSALAKEDPVCAKEESTPPKSASPSWIFLGALGLSALVFFASSSSTGGLTNYSAPYVLCSSEPSKVYTVDAKNSQTQCILIDNGYIAKTGTLEEVQGHWTTNVTGSSRPKLQIRYTPPGSIIVPGLSDAHAHLLEYGASRELALEGTKDIQETVTRVKQYILAHPEIQMNTSTYVLGGGWDHTVWPTTRWPTAADLDSDPVLRGRPIILQSKDCHALWVSPKVVEMNFPFPDAVEGGIIFRDEYGQPNGMFLDNAQDIIFQPALTDDDLMRRFSIAVQDAVAVGLTSVHDAGLNPMSLKFFTKLAELKKLPIRIYGMTFFDENAEYWGNQTKPKIDPENRLTARSVKIFADGALRTSGAALYEPYADDSTTTGAMRITPEVLHKFLPLFLRDGWQVNVHAIGDRANGIVLDVFEASLKGINISASRPRLEHAQIITQADRERLGKLGVIASIQPTHAISDMWYAQDRLGPERIKNLYAFRSIIDSGARIAMGSDFPVESPNPLFWILRCYYASFCGWKITSRPWRMVPGGASQPPRSSQRDDHRPGIRVLHGVDIMTIGADQVLATKVIATVIDGTPVYGRF
ncbi:putative amidohydrolase YtcJ [Mycena sanguinolenta]|uniref:Putative amidohydrolase YtcJ n=1 Tax=Mycena sanguinolenta TaxID=230812 RepID=A0A8H6ZFL2_9AGAR|nr:putative amidohydrolase YtcJ [Mycena sanguinolenta]